MVYIKKCVKTIINIYIYIYIDVIYDKTYQDITDDLLELSEISNSLKGMGINAILSLGNDAKIRLRITDDKFL